MASSWKIERYARYVTNTDGGQWQYYDDRQSELLLTLTDSAHLILCHGKVVLESHSLSTARAWMRGMAKSDSMLVMYKIKNETRRFRFKFYGTKDAKGKDVCDECVRKLSMYFPIKITTEPDPATSLTETVEDMEHTKTTEEESKEYNVKTLEGEVELSEIAELLTGVTKTMLPASYQQCNLSTENINMVVRLCLTDHEFPAFVHSVEQELNMIVDESKI